MDKIIGKTLNKILYTDEYTKEKEYATIKRGKVKVPIGSKQFKFLMWKHLPLTVKGTKHGHKVYERLNVK